jgi:hypothetical protein
MRALLLRSICCGSRHLLNLKLNLKLNLNLKLKLMMMKMKVRQMREISPPKKDENPLLSHALLLYASEGSCRRREAVLGSFLSCMYLHRAGDMGDVIPCREAGGFRVLAAQMHHHRHHHHHLRHNHHEFTRFRPLSPTLQPGYGKTLTLEADPNHAPRRVLHASEAIHEHDTLIPKSMNTMH